MPQKFHPCQVSQPLMTLWPQRGPLRAFLGQLGRKKIQWRHNMCQGSCLRVSSPNQYNQTKSKQCKRNIDRHQGSTHRPRLFRSWLVLLPIKMSKLSVTDLGFSTPKLAARLTIVTIMNSEKLVCPRPHQRLSLASQSAGKWTSRHLFRQQPVALKIWKPLKNTKVLENNLGEAQLDLEATCI